MPIGGLLIWPGQQEDYELDASFGGGSLFIDDCPDGSTTCYQVSNGSNVVVGPLSDASCCFNSNAGGCRSCTDDYQGAHYGKLCHDAWPDVCNFYTNGVDGWDCYVYPVTDCQE